MLRIAFFLFLVPCLARAAAPPVQDPSGSRNLLDVSMEEKLTALRLAIEDLKARFPVTYPRGQEFLERAAYFEAQWRAIRQTRGDQDQTSGPLAARFKRDLASFQSEALLANPLLDFDQLLLIKRRPIGDPRRDEDSEKGLGKYIGLPQQSSWQIHTMPNVVGWTNEICVLSPVRPDGVLRAIYQPPDRELISDLDLHYQGQRLLFSMPDRNRFWQLMEIGVDDGSLRQLSSSAEPKVHQFDGCYLPDGGIAFLSTAPFQGVPCNAGVTVAMLYRMNGDGGNVRRLCFDQDHSYCPTVLNDGRLLYLRWEYTDIPHVWARYLFTMNPDGTGQRAYYGSGSYWPNAIFYARPIPGHPTKVAGIVTGHHMGRVGELCLFDPAISPYSTAGVVQRIPGRGRPVQPIIQDRLTLYEWPKFVHPWPLDENYFLVTAKPGPHALWGVYLADVFDNLVLVKELEDHALLEPIPLRARPVPPALPTRTQPERGDAVVYVEDIYAGPGLKGVPRGSVKALRLVTYQFAYQGVAGINHRVGADGPWEPKRILGTVPVEADGSAFFKIPARAPLSFQPLDEHGQALQLMRSWTTAMPGESVSCTGCHESNGASPMNRPTLALRKQPTMIEPWHGPERGFSFSREVQPVLDRYCVGCHGGNDHGSDGVEPDLRGQRDVFVVYKNGDPRAKVIRGQSRETLVTQYGAVFEPSYVALRALVRVGGLESDLRVLAPGEFRANTTELIQMLSKGHHGVLLDDEAWERLFTWIDLNAPCHGNWEEVVGAAKIAHDRACRLELLKIHAGEAVDYEIMPELPQPTAAAPRPRSSSPVRPDSAMPRLEGWPWTTEQARQRQGDLSRSAVRTLDLGDGITLELVRIPAGEFVMGDAEGEDDEQPPCVVRIDRPFWMGRFEVSNEQFNRYDPAHDSRFEHMSSWIFSEEGLGWPLNEFRQPVVRVSWEEAMEFCQWLSRQIGEPVSLPTEAQWEYACRAGTAGSFYYGGIEDDFSSYANMADLNIRRLVYDARDQYSPDLTPRDSRFDDGALVPAEVGHYLPNAWGLHDMHGNAWEWTRSLYRPYPYDAADGRNDLAAEGTRVVRGGSWYDRPRRCRSAYRLAYPGWQKVYNVGFRVVVEERTLAGP